MVDVFVYVVILNLAIEYLPTVISESFSLSLLTALLLKVTLEVVLLVKGAVMARLRTAATRRARTTAAVMLWAVAAGSKLIVLWLIEATFGGSVSLGGFIPVTLDRPGFSGGLVVPSRRLPGRWSCQRSSGLRVRSAGCLRSGRGGVSCCTSRPIPGSLARRRPGRAMGHVAR